MDIQKQIKKYIEEQTEVKRADIETWHECILKALPKCKLWFFDDTDENGKIVSNSQ